ncbi:MAG TPA: hypothetical protein VJ836_02885 [Candidatus Saccharimonadales bacterium]|nr:hypothetical protein [Candidatus Saccharimonadales bacterium]
MAEQDPNPEDLLCAPGAFSIIFPRPMPLGSLQLLQNTQEYQLFKGLIHSTVGDPARKRRIIGRITGMLARPDDPGAEVLKLCKRDQEAVGVTIVDPRAAVEEAPDAIRHCGERTAAALGQVVAAMQQHPLPPDAVLTGEVICGLQHPGRNLVSIPPETLYG